MFAIVASKRIAITSRIKVAYKHITNQKIKKHTLIGIMKPIWKVSIPLYSVAGSIGLSYTLYRDEKIDKNKNSAALMGAVIGTGVGSLFGVSAPFVYPLILPSIVISNLFEQNQNQNNKITVPGRFNFTQDDFDMLIDAQ